MWIIWLFLTSFFLILYWPRWQKRNRLQRWRKALDLDKHQACFDNLYKDVNGFAISRAARQKGDAIEFLYGEIEFEAFIALLSLCPIVPQTVFYDLGSGSGKAVLACAMVFAPQKSCGIEYFPELHQAAHQQCLRLQKIVDYADKALRIDFKQADFLNTSFEDATLIFINATAFFGGHWQKISHHLEQVKPNTVIISTSKAIQSDLFICLRKTEVSMSWGIVQAYIQQRVDTPLPGNLRH